MIPPLTAIFAYPLVAFTAFKTTEWRIGLILTILLGHMFLPSKQAYNLPLLPSLTKETVPALAALLLLLMFAPKTKGPNPEIQNGWMPRDFFSRIAVLSLVAGAFLTVLTNLDPLNYGVRRLPAMRIYDAFSLVLTTCMVLLPLLLARKYLATDKSHQLILKILAIVGCIYTLPIIYELVMSPQLNRIVYGYFPHDWKQHVRGGGYRPLVFMKHGLVLAIFMCCTILAAIIYARVSGTQRKTLYFAAAGWLFLILAVCNSLGAFAIAVVLIPVVFFLGMRTQLMIAAIISATILVYPMLRGADLVPTGYVVQWAESIEKQRASSLKFRLANEDILLEKANQRPLFGWGGWDRARVFDEQGRDISTTDGAWVIRIGEAGWVGYLGQFGLLCIPTILLFVRSRKLGIGLATSGLSIVLAANLVDLIPNAGLTPVTWMIAGALIGRLERQSADDEDTALATEPIPADRRSKYSRFSPAHPSRALGTSSEMRQSQSAQADAQR